MARHKKTRCYAGFSGFLGLYGMAWNDELVPAPGFELGTY